ncbi:MAG: 3-keto-disaccharide hydrolase [bacterium]|jgi:hypothetical protein
MRKWLIAGCLLIGTMTIHAGETAQEADGWISLFNGENLDGWRAVENPSSFSVQDGMIVGNGPRAHLFYLGPVENHKFRNFIFRADIKTVTGANSGIFFHTAFMNKPSPTQGYEVQINNYHPRERVRTGSLYKISEIFESAIPDNEWVTYEITVRGKDVTVKADDKTLLEYTEPEDHKPPRSHPGRFLSSGTFALQNHDPKSIVYFRNIKVKVLPDT